MHAIRKFEEDSESERGTMDLPADDGEVDATMASLMAETFGPADGDAQAETGKGRVERGLDQIAEMTDPASQGLVEWLLSSDDALDPCGYDADAKVCFRCGAPSPKSNCARCGVAGYCDRDCQTADWGKKGAFGGHKVLCAGYKSLGKAQCVPPAARRAAVESILAQIRLYLCPFALYHGSGGGEGKERGFCFVQSPCSLAQLALPAPRDCAGRPLEEGRSVILHFVTLSEFETEIAPRDAALTARVGEPLTEAVARHDDRSQVAVLLRTGCGYVGVAIVPLVPEWRVCKALAADYEQHSALQLNIDDK